MAKEYQYFNDKVEFTGKHADMIDKLWVANQIQASYFKRLIDLYLIAAIIGFRMDQTEEIDTSTHNSHTIFKEQMIGAINDKFQDVLRIMLLLDESVDITPEERMNRAFRPPKNDEEFNANVKIFNDYARGGIAFLYKNFALKDASNDDNYTDPRIANIMQLLEKFK
ncbi:MAG: hypothetical protein K0R54_4883 [Clostridiaceae bacterium]|jgi:hypothetical protein|nr:hypothetical protein [Clostridiaceae bacterium]